MEAVRDGGRYSAGDGELVVIKMSVLAGNRHCRRVKQDMLT